MKRSFCIILSLASLNIAICRSEIIQFLDAGDDVRRHMLNGVADAIVQGYDIAIIHSRPDEWLRTDGALDSRVKRTLGLLDYRFVTFLKGESTIENYGIGYLYPPKLGSRGYIPFIPARPSGHESYHGKYRPSFSQSDNLMRLVFLKRQADLLKDRVIEARGGDEIYKDLKSMEPGAFLEKYGIEDVFESKVFVCKESAAFKVDYNVPDLPSTEAMRMNSANQSLSEGAVPRLQSLSRLVHISDAEVSELVFLSYMFDKRYTSEDYKTTAKQKSEFVSYIRQDDINTEFGKSLFKVLWGRNNPPQE